MTQTHQPPADPELPEPARASAAETDAGRPALPTAADDTSLGRRGGVLIWASIGLLGVLLSLWAYGNWIASDVFAPVPIQGPDVFDDGTLVALRVFEALSAIVLALLVWFGMIRPIIRRGELGLMGKMILGGIVGFVLDAYLNANEYLFAWNQHNLNTGVWTPWLPFYQDDAPGQYAESVVWGLPMYVYFCAFVAFMAVQTSNFLRRRFPRLSRPQIYSIIFVEAFLFDLIVENIIIRTTEAYAYPQTVGVLTLFPGSQYQFPLTEPFLVALVGLAFTWLNIRANESPDGRSPVEYGLERVPRPLQGTVSTLAVVGFCFTVLALVYHVPFGWIGLHADSVADLPSYLLPAGGFEG